MRLPVSRRLDRTHESPFGADKGYPEAPCEDARREQELVATGMIQTLHAGIRDGLGALLYAGGLTVPARAAREHLTVVTFHRVLTAGERAQYPLRGLAVTSERLAWLLEFFRHHYTCVPLAEAADAWNAGERASKPWLAVTFDDALSDNFRHAAPVLERFGTRATFFVPCDAVERRELLWHDRLAWSLQAGFAADRRSVSSLLRELGVGGEALASPRLPLETVMDLAKRLAPSAREAFVNEAARIGGDAAIPDWDGMMSWDELRELRRRGHEIGSHSLSHPLLPQCDDAQLEREIAGSKGILDAQIREPIASFCYPNGDWDERAVQAVARSGYRWAVTTASGPNRPGASAFTLRRCNIVEEQVERRDGTPSEARVAWRLSGLARGRR